MRKPKGTSSTRPQRASFEYTFLVTLTLILLAVGIVMVFSASWASAYFAEGEGDSYLYLKRELLFASLGLILMFGLARFDFTRLRKAAPLLMLLSLSLLFLVFIPGVGVTAKGATRWIGYGPAAFQPSELAKLAVVLYVATVMFKRPRLLGDLKSLFLPVLGLPVLACLLVLFQPDMGTAIIIVLAMAGMLVIGGARKKDIAVMGGVAAVLGFAYVALAPYRMARLTTFIDPWSDPRESGFQIIQSMVALGSGGIFGVGIGESIQKFNYLPEAHTDMIVAIIGEELGLLGVLGVVFLYAAFAYVGYRIALNCDNPFGKYLAAGLTSLMVGQAAVNLGAVTGLLPLTGIPLPIISYGGSNLIVMLSGIGILLNIAVNPRGKIATVPQRKLRAVKGGDGGRRYRGASRPGAGNRRSAQGQRR
ncbi:MAG: putative lipid II flippase FtsW [Thermoleophilia bacterium]|nr:putative lipid II flippase FtsW [Thermoleophilia bacterium]